MKNKDIEIQVKGLLTQYGYSFEQDTYVDIVDFARKLGFVVGNAELEDNEDGFLAIQPGESQSSNKIIGVNAKRSLDWKRFIIAHELAHSVLHYQEGQIYLHRENKKGKNDEENDADYFAAALLMPKESFKRQYELLENEKLNRNAICLQLASIYRVPLESVSRRIGEVFLEKY